MANLAGTLLVARPTLRDSFFSHSVILMLQHSKEGAFGLIINRRARGQELPFPVFIGGPCKMDGLLLLHGETGWLESDAKQKLPTVCPGVFLGDAACFERIGTEENPRYRVIAGYSGWGPGQLEAELEQGAWVVLPGRGDIIFDTPLEDLWENLAPVATPEPSLN